jgi:succinoglycan biosynthesis transport protein ExoP
MSPSKFQGQPAAANESDLDLANVIRIILRRRFLLLNCVAGALILAVLFLVVTKRRYRADAQMQLLRENAALAMPSSSAEESDTTLQLGVTMETYVGVLTSDQIALRVIRELGLESTPEFKGRSRFGLSPALKGEENLPLEQTRFRREKILQRFKSNLAVSAVTGSRLILVSYFSTNPELAKKILNQLLADFVDYDDNVRYNASKDTEGWLSKQLVDLKQNVEETQQRAAELQHETGIYGTDGSHDLVLARLEALNQELINAEQNRIVKEAILHIIQSSNPEAISNLSGNAGQAGSPESVNALALIQSLRQQEATLSTRLAELENKFGSNYPRVIETNEQLATVRKDIANESQRLTQRAQNDFGAAQVQENTLRKQFEEQKGLAAQSNDVAIQYLIANREATSSRDLYEHLLEKLKEIGIMAGMHDTNIDIIDHAHVGASPASPNIPVTIAGALGAGLLLGICAVFLRDGLDQTWRDPDSLQRAIGKPLLGVIPLASSIEFTRNSDSSTTFRGSERPLWNAATLWPMSAFTEAFRSIRTSMLRSSSNSNIKVIMVTSPSMSEGKSTVVFCLAGVLAQQGLRVLVIDADLRRRELSASLGVDSTPGLSDLLADSEGRITIKGVIRTEDPVDFLSAGSPMFNPSELLSSKKVRDILSSVGDAYDYVLVDTVPVLSLSDTLGLLQNVDASILVCRSGITTRTSLSRAFSLLNESAKPVIGTVFNAVDVEAPEYTYFYGKSASEYQAIVGMAGSDQFSRRTA